MWINIIWLDSVFFSGELLSSTCRTTNINVAMVDSSPLKLMHKLFRNALHPWKWCIAKGCTSVYSREYGWVLVVKVQQCRTWLGWTVLSCVSLLQPYLPNATIRSSECSNTGEFIPVFPYKLFRESLQVQNLVTFSQHQCKITWRKLCFQGLHQWLLIIKIATSGSFGAMLQQTNNLNERF